MCPIRIASGCDEHQDKHSILSYSAKLQTGTHDGVCVLREGLFFASDKDYSELKAKCHFLSIHISAFLKDYCKLSVRYVASVVYFLCILMCCKLDCGTS